MYKFIFFTTLIFSQFTLFAQSNEQTVIRGTWITNIASAAMHSPENVKAAVLNCSKNGLTDIFVVVWNGGVTMFPSKVVQKYIGIQQADGYNGFDPLKAFIDEGHKVGLRVHAWFEFGASYAYKDSAENNWLVKYPSWLGKTNKGELLKKNGFFWWNTMNPEVQSFLKELIVEVITEYQVDGIQGDDRLPAMPSEGGYDDYSIHLYKTDFNGNTPPSNPKDTAFIQWKSDKLSAFGKSIYTVVKKIKPACIVSWAPSIYPWSKEQYLQDWPKWLNDGYADFIFPQLYRYKINDYEKILKELAIQVPINFKHKVFPGILTSLGGGYRVEQKMLDDMISLNRKYGYNGEVLFYYESFNHFQKPLYEK